VTIHPSAVARMQRDVPMAADALRRAIADDEEELAESRADIAAELARIREDELYVAQVERRLAARRERLAQLEASP